MVGNLKTKKQQGFTIIEVLIVLAIAGLIMLIVFLAVPALQRNSRNTQRKNDSASIASAIANYISNNGGKLPDQVGSEAGNSTNNLLLRKSTNTTNTETAKLGYYVTASTAAVTWGSSTADIFISAPASAPTMSVVASSATESATAVSSESISIVSGYNCNSDNNNIGAASPRTAAILYVTESGSGNGSLQCVEQ